MSLNWPKEKPNFGPIDAHQDAKQMSDHQRETEFLRRCIGYDDTEARHELEARITQAERDERCIRRAVWAVVVLTAVGVAGLGYAAVFIEDFPNGGNQRVVRIFGALGLGSLICLLGFLGYWGFCRKELNMRRDECRRLAAQLMESRLGKPRVPSEPIPTAKEEVLTRDGGA